MAGVSGVGLSVNYSLERTRNLCSLVHTWIINIFKFWFFKTMFDFLLKEVLMCTKIVLHCMLRFTTARYNASY